MLAESRPYLRCCWSQGPFREALFRGMETGPWAAPRSLSPHSTAQARNTPSSCSSQALLVLPKQGKAVFWVGGIRLEFVASPAPIH